MKKYTLKQFEKDVQKEINKLPDTIKSNIKNFLIEVGKWSHKESHTFSVFIYTKDDINNGYSSGRSNPYPAIVEAVENLTKGSYKGEVSVSIKSDGKD